MARDDVEIIRRAYDAWNRRDYGAAQELLDPTVVFDATARIMNPDTYHGHEGFRRLVEEVGEVWDQWRIDPDEFVECGDRVLVLARARARGRSSGIELDEEAFNVWTVRAGRVVRVAFHYEKDAAVRDAGSRDEAQRA